MQNFTLVFTPEFTSFFYTNIYIRSTFFPKIKKAKIVVKTGAKKLKSVRKGENHLFSGL